MGVRAQPAQVPPGFTLGPLTTYAEPAAMRAWVAAADPGAVMIYASGPALGPHPAAEAARALCAAGAVELFQQRAARGHGFEYCARRRPHESVAGAGGEDGGSIVPSSPDPARLSADELRVFAIVRDCAEAGQPCPSLSAIARRGRLKSRSVARHALDRLVAKRLLARLPAVAGGSRVYAIVSTGETTQPCSGERSAARPERGSIG